MLKVNFYKAKHTLIYNKNLSFKKDEIYLGRNDKHGSPSVYSSEGILHSIHRWGHVFSLSHPVNTPQRFRRLDDIFESVGSITVKNKKEYAEIQDMYDWVRTLPVYPSDSTNLDYINVEIGSSLVQVRTSVVEMLLNRAFTLYKPFVYKGYRASCLFRGNVDTISENTFILADNSLSTMNYKNVFPEFGVESEFGENTQAVSDVLKYAVGMTLLLEFVQGNLMFNDANLYITQSNYINLFIKSKVYYTTLERVNGGN